MKREEGGARKEEEGGKREEEEGRKQEGVKKENNKIGAKNE